MTHLSSEAVLKKVNDLTQPLAFFQQHYIIIFRGLTLTLYSYHSTFRRNAKVKNKGSYHRRQQNFSLKSYIFY